MLDASSAQVRLGWRAGGDIQTFWFLYGVKRREFGVGMRALKGNTRDDIERECADKKKKNRWTRGQSVCKQSREYAWAGCSNPGNR